jgi:hypothetical protein
MATEHHVLLTARKQTQAEMSVSDSVADVVMSSM